MEAKDMGSWRHVRDVEISKVISKASIVRREVDFLYVKQKHLESAETSRTALEFGTHFVSPHLQSSDLMLTFSRDLTRTTINLNPSSRYHILSDTSTLAIKVLEFRLYPLKRRVAHAPLQHSEISIDKTHGEITRR
jgi:hypothetical protein